MWKTPLSHPRHLQSCPVLDSALLSPERWWTHNYPVLPLAFPSCCRQTSFPLLTHPGFRESPTAAQTRVFLYDTFSALITLFLEGIPFLRKTYHTHLDDYFLGKLLSSGASLGTSHADVKHKLCLHGTIPTISQWKGPTKIKHPFCQDSDSSMLEIQSTKLPKESEVGETEAKFISNLKKRLAIPVSPHGHPWILTSGTITSDHHELINYQMPTYASHCTQCLCQKSESDEGDNWELRSQVRLVNGDTGQKEIQDHSHNRSWLCHISCNFTICLEQGEIKRTFQTKQFLICLLWSFLVQERKSGAGLAWYEK